MSSCSDRERTNPLDPVNPETRGAPVGLKIQSNRDSMKLSWEIMEVNDYTYTEIYKGSSKTDLTYWTTVSANISSINDSGLIYDTPYAYAVKGITRFSESKLSDPVMFIPGPVNIWVSDRHNWNLWKIGYDGSHQLFQEALIAPSAIEYDSSRQRLWVAKSLEQQIISFENDTQSYSFSLPGIPVDIALDSENQILYVIMQNVNQVKGYDYSGNEVLSVAMDDPFSVSSKIAWDRLSKSVWTTSPSLDRVYRLSISSSGNKVTVYPSIENPGPIRADPTTGKIWIGTGTGIARINKNGDFEIFMEDYFITDISLHPDTGDCYYTGYSLIHGEWSSGYLPYAQPEFIQEILGDEFDFLYKILVVPGTEAPGVLVQQYSTKKLLRFTGSGIQIGEMEGFSTGLDFVLE